MAKQLTFNLRPARSAASRGICLDFPIDWQALDRRAARTAKAILAGRADLVRQGLFVRRYAADIALLDALRPRRAGKHLKQALRGSGRLPVHPAVLAAATPAGRRLHRLAEELSEKLMREESVLCG